MMAKQTSNFGFIKPEINEFYNVEVQNKNWDKVDEELKNAIPTPKTEQWTFTLEDGSTVIKVVHVE